MKFYRAELWKRWGQRGEKNNNIRAERGAMRARATHHSARLAASPPPPPLHPTPSPPPPCQTVICTATTPACQTRGIHFVSAITARVTDKFVFSSLSPVGF